ncbi:ribonuclease HII [Bacteroidia bacterium]|nr:ribonuclease HII [Bacteroidia bacterium]
MGRLIFTYKDYKIIAGTDEAGRGCLAGPVVAAAVVLSKPIPELNDSKKLSKKRRNELRKKIEENALSFQVAFVDHIKIDEINILNASILAMHHATLGLQVKPEILLVDGNRFKPLKQIPHQTIIKGDAQFQCIAAASILAKTYRDDYMDAMHEQYPEYGWDTNAGYPTVKHREGIKAHGPTKIHRMTFRLLP